MHSIGEERSIKPFPRSCRVVPGKVCAGAYPGDREADGMEAGLKGHPDQGPPCVPPLLGRQGQDRYRGGLLPRPPWDHDGRHAFAMISQFRAGDPRAHEPSLETAGQIEMVLSWKEGE